MCSPRPSRLSGATVPAGHALEGVDILPYLAGEKTGAPHARLFWRSGGGARFAVREGDWKLVGGEKAATQLFNLATDIGESQDLAAAKPEVLARLRQAYDQWNQDNIAPALRKPADETAESREEGARMNRPCEFLEPV